MNTIDLGKTGEDIACKYLEKVGFTIVVRNYRKKWGEIDIVARETTNGKVHFFEVKSISVISFNKIYSNGHFQGHSPEENVHFFKAKQIKRMIETYMMEFHTSIHGANRCDTFPEFQFHILCIYMSSMVRRAKVRWLKNIIL
jgi:putative endonuclease